MPKLRLKIGLDFHGVINERPEYFAEFCRETIRHGWEIHIITGGPQDVVKKMLDDWKVPYTNVFAILDYYDASGQVTHYDTGEFKVPEKLWDMAKAEYCSSQGINIHIDDSTKYGKWFLTPYCHYDKVAHSCITPSRYEVNFSNPPAEALAQIAEIISKIQYF